MKKLVLLLVFSTSFLSFSQGQVELNDIAAAQLYKSQKIKDSLVIALLKINTTDSIFIKTFEASEKHWNIFVEEQFKLKFPEYNSWETRREIYGSQFDMLNCNFMKLYCDLRIQTLYNLFEE